MRRIRRKQPGAVSEQDVTAKENQRRVAEATVLQAQAALHAARLDLEFTQVRAPVDGYVTNLNLRLGSQAVANQPTLALVDVNSFWIAGFFKETVLGPIGRGDRAIVTFMTYPTRPSKVGWKASAGALPRRMAAPVSTCCRQSSPTFEWIRLAQRVPVRIHLLEVPDDIKLRVGTTASVLVLTGTAGRKSDKPVAAVPRPLQ